MANDCDAGQLGPAVGITGAPNADQECLPKEQAFAGRGAQNIPICVIDAGSNEVGEAVHQAAREVLTFWANHAA